jgi:putative flippase GtrA
VTDPRPGPRRAALARLVRYGATSVVAFAISEITLLLLYGYKVLGATEAAVVANLAGTVPSYLMSRYWIWSEAPRSRLGRQVVMYWTTSVVCIAGTSLATGAIAGLVPAGERFHLVVAGLGFLVVNVVFWVAKYVIYQRIIFPVVPPVGVENPVASPGAPLAAGPVTTPVAMPGGMDGPEPVRPPDRHDELAEAGPARHRMVLEQG